MEAINGAFDQIKQRQMYEEFERYATRGEKRNRPIKVKSFEC